MRYNIAMYSKKLRDLKPYVPGEQPADRPYIKLNANENAYPPPQPVVDAVNGALSENPLKLARYPDPDSTVLREAIADMLNKTGGVFANSEKAAAALEASGLKITKDMIFCGNGSDEVLSLLFYTFFDSNESVVSPLHSYSFYPVYAGYYDMNLVRVPLKEDFSLDKEAMLAESKKACGMIFANPNAPTGIALSTAEVEEMLKKYPEDKAFVVDEAYADFGTESVLPLLAKYKNLVVVRTFSKSLSFAGMRMGFAVASPEAIAAMTTVKNSFNHFPADVLCQTAATAAAKCTDYFCEKSRAIADTRDRFADGLSKAGYFVVPSSTNFVFARHPGLSAPEVYAKVKEAGILIRHFNTPGIENFVRITIGTDEQMNSLLKVMEDL